MASQKMILNKDDVCAILKACGEAQVAVLKFGDLYVEFGRHAETPPVVAEAPDSTPSEALEEAQKQAAEESLAVDADEVKMAQLELMRIERPAEYEDLILSGKLGDDDEQDDEEA